MPARRRVTDEEFATRLAKALHEVDCGCGDFGDPTSDEDDRYITAARAALASVVAAEDDALLRLAKARAARDSGARYPLDEVIAQAVAQANRGETEYLGSFAQYAEDPDEEQTP